MRSKEAIAKAGLVVAAIGVLIAAAAFVNDLLLRGHKETNIPASSFSQTTHGSDSPAIANVRGNVIVKRGSSE